MSINEDRVLFLLRGIPGSGKTSLAQFLIRDGGFMFAADDLFYKEDGSYVFEGDRLGEAHDRCYDNTELAMARNLSPIVVHNTFTQTWELDDYLDLAERYNYQVVSLVVENRHGNKSLHNPPDAVVASMIRRFEIQLAPEEEIWTERR